MAEHSTCLVCGGQQLSDMERYGMHSLVRCGSCGLVFSKLVPTPQELEQNYSAYPREFDMDPLTLKRYDQLLHRLVKYRKTNRILDIGCGSGHFLFQAKQQGWEPYGTEYMEDAVNACLARGIEVEQTSTQEASFAPESFDVITMIEVIEHINYPVNELEAVVKLLRPGGVLYLTTPNFNSLSRRLAKENWNVIVYPDHLVYYTPSTLHRLLVDAGLKRQKLATTGFSVTRMKQSMSKEKQEGPCVTAEADKGLRAQTDSSFLFGLVRTTANGVLTTFKSGDTLKALYRKP